MATVGQHIAQLRLHLGGLYDDDTVFTDEALYRYLNYGNGIVAKRLSSSSDKMSDWDVRGFTLELEDTRSFLGRLECDVKISKFAIPPVYTGQTRMLMWVRKSTGESIGEFSFDHTIDILDPVKATAMGYKIINEYLVIYNAPVEFKYVNVFGKWADIAAWAALTDADGNAYFDMETDDWNYPLDHQHTLMVYDIIKKGLIEGVLQVPNINHPH